MRITITIDVAETGDKLSGADERYITAKAAQAASTPSHWGCGKHGVIYPVGADCVECVVQAVKAFPYDEVPW